MSISFKDFILELEREFRSKSLPALSVSDFLVSEAMATTELRSGLTKTNRKWIKQYKGKFDESGLQVADLQQNPSVRPRWGGRDFPTLTTGCTKMYNVKKDQLYSPDLRHVKLVKFPHSFLCIQ